MKEKSFVADKNGFIRVPLDVNKDYPNGGRFGYIVKVVAPFDKKEQVDLYTYAKLSHETKFYYRDIWNREYTVLNTDGPVTYWNYLHRYTGSSGASAKDLVNLTLIKRELLGTDGEDKHNTKTIPGAGFKLTNNQGFQDYALTGADGKLTFTKLKPGDYFLEEVVTPKGYTPINVVWDIHVDQNGTVTVSDSGATGLIEGGTNSLTVWNRKTPIDKPVLQFPNIPNRIEFTKVGESEAPLEGATLELRKSDTADGKYVVVTGPNGPRDSGKDGKLFWTNLAPGYYQVWETKAPAGYSTPSKEVATFRVDMATGEIKDLQINGRDPVGENIVRNLRPMKIELLKVDGERRPIGVDKVKFLLKAAVQKTPPDATDSLSIEKDLTNSDPCLVEIPDSWDGEYILTEDRAPAGYIKTTNRYHIRVDRTNRIVQLTRVTNEQGIEIPYLDQGLLSKKPIDLYTDKMVGQVKLQVENIQPRYPSTGGYGPSRWFALIGCAVMIGSAVWFIASDRKTRRRTLRKGGDAQ